MERKTPRQAALQPAQRQGDAGEEQRKILNPSAIFTRAFSLPKRFPASDNIAFKGKKDLSTKAAAPISRSPVFSPLFPRGEAPDAPDLAQVHLKPEEDPTAPAAPRHQGAITKAQTPAAPARADSPGGPVPCTNFPVARLRGPAGRRTNRSTGGRHWYPPQGSTADGTLRPATGSRSKGGPSGARGTQRGGRAARGWGHRGAAAGGQPWRASSRRAGSPLGLPAPQQLQQKEEGSEEEEEEERDCALQPKPLPSGLPPTSGR